MPHTVPSSYQEHMSYKRNLIIFRLICFSVSAAPLHLYRGAPGDPHGTRVVGWQRQLQSRPRYICSAQDTIVPPKIHLSRPRFICPAQLKRGSSENFHSITFESFRDGIDRYLYKINSSTISKL